MHSNIINIPPSGKHLTEASYIEERLKDDEYNTNCSINPGNKQSSLDIYIPQPIGDQRGKFRPKAKYLMSSETLLSHRATL